jgi:poly(ADP-ribose) glycohydrolase ARH3
MSPAEAAGDAIAGALLGTALGDALGAPFEGRRRVEPAEVDAWLAADGPLTWTDDTAMLLALGESLVERRGEVDPQQLGDAFAAAYRAEPWRGYGGGPPRIFALAELGVPYLDAAASLFEGTGSLGNGAAMRVAAAAAAGHPDPERTATLADRQAAVTHSHAEGRDGAVLLANVIHSAIDTTGDRPLAIHADQALGTRRWSPTFARIIERLTQPDPDGEDAVGLAASFGTAVTAATSVPAAIVLATRRPRDVVATIRVAVSLGGDTDTVAAMAGAVIGAHLGAATIPTRLLERLEARERIVDLAMGLAAL